MKSCNWNASTLQNIIIALSGSAAFLVLVQCVVYFNTTKIREYILLLLLLLLFNICSEIESWVQTFVFKEMVAATFSSSSSC